MNEYVYPTNSLTRSKVVKAEEDNIDYFQRIKNLRRANCEQIVGFYR
jgi:hypothetical protein